MFTGGAEFIFALDFDIFGTFSKQMQQIVLVLLQGYLAWMKDLSIDPDLSAGWYRGQYGVMLAISFWLLIPIIFAATVGALLYGGLQQVLRTYLWALPIGVFGGVACIAVVNLLLKVDNELTIEVLRNTDEHVAAFYDNFNKSVKDAGTEATANGAAAGQAAGGTAGQAAGAAAGAGAGATTSAAAASWSFLQAVLMFFMVILVFMLWVEGFFRIVMIYMSVLFIPFSLAAYLWGPVRVWFYNLCELVFTMVFAKFITCSVAGFGFMIIGYAVTGNGTWAPNQLGLLLGGIIVLVIACLSGPVLVAFVLSPSHQIFSFKSAKQLTPYNHDRKFAGDLLKKNFDSVKGVLGK